MSKRMGPGPQPDELNIPVNFMAEDQDMADELEENVGVPPRKVTMEEFVGAEKAFDDLIDTEELEIERTPFRPGKDTKFVLTRRQKSYLQDCVDEIDKYIDGERGLRDLEANQKLKALNDAMKKTLEVGLDGLSPDERKTIEGFNDVMDTQYASTNRTLGQNISNCKGAYGLNMGDIHAGLDMLGVMTGIPANYKGSKAQAYKKNRADIRKDNVDAIMDKYSEEAQELVDTANTVGLKDLQKKYEGTEIGKKLGQVNTIIGDLGNYKLGSYYIDNHLMEADDLGTFLNKKGENGKTNYDTIAEELLGQKNGAEKKQAFDSLLGQLNTVCDLDIGVPYAIEAQAEHNWDKGEINKINNDLIEGFDKKVFGNLHPYSDGELLDSIQTMDYMLKKMMQDNLQLRTGNYTRMSGAYLGFESIVEKVKRNSAFSHLEKQDKYIHVLNFGKNLHRKQKLVTGGEKSLYELLAETYEKNGKSREELDKTLNALSDEKKLGLKISIPGKEAEAGQNKPVPPEQHKPYVKKIAEVQRSVRREENPQKLKMALASILAMRRMSVDPAHKDHKKIRSKAAMAKALALMDTKAFKELTDKMSVEDLAKKINHPGNFDKEFTQKLKEKDLAEYEKRLSNETYKKKIASSARNTAEKMDRTGTGVYLLGVKRGSNSGMYDRAVLAMRRAGKNPDAATTMSSVQTVKEYLSNKMTRRKSPSGKERWQDCMEFLHEAMPKEEFKQYCDEINKVRKAKEGSIDYIEPDDFIPQAKKTAAQADPEKNKEVQNIVPESGGQPSI